MGSKRKAKAKVTKLGKRYGRAKAKASPAPTSVLRALAIETTASVLSEATRRAIEKIAEDFARDLHADPAYREEIRKEATAAAREIAAHLRANRRERETP